MRSIAASQDGRVGLRRQFQEISSARLMQTLICEYVAFSLQLALAIFIKKARSRGRSSMLSVRCCSATNSVLKFIDLIDEVLLAYNVRQTNIIGTNSSMNLLGRLSHLPK
ncbi:hypothetical protein V6N13_038379 [Hibiscus sabdariffa]|uniref:Uncharacterized protein n=1 Tax=Hibiscus sabdariffa TaxID=183260 RepID=A0ABR2S232_9ROSI